MKIPPPTLPATRAAATAEGGAPNLPGAAATGPGPRGHRVPRPANCKGTPNPRTPAPSAAEQRACSPTQDPATVCSRRRAAPASLHVSAASLPTRTPLLRDPPHLHPPPPGDRAPQDPQPRGGGGSAGRRPHALPAREGTTLPAAGECREGGRAPPSRTRTPPTAPLPGTRLPPPASRRPPNAQAERPRAEQPAGRRRMAPNCHRPPARPLPPRGPRAPPAPHSPRVLRPPPLPWAPRTLATRPPPRGGRSPGPRGGNPRLTAASDTLGFPLSPSSPRHRPRTTRRQWRPSCRTPCTREQKLTFEPRTRELLAGPAAAHDMSPFHSHNAGLAALPRRGARGRAGRGERGSPRKRLRREPPPGPRGAENALRRHQRRPPPAR